MSQYFTLINIIIVFVVFISLTVIYFIYNKYKSKIFKNSRRKKEIEIGGNKYYINF